MTNKPLKSLNQDASLADIGRQLWQLWQLMKVHWRPMVIYPLLFGLVGLGVGLVLHTDKKKAEFIIAAEEQGASGMDGLLAQFGLDIGSSNPGGVFEGEQVVGHVAGPVLQFEGLSVGPHQVPGGSSVDRRHRHREGPRSIPRCGAARSAGRARPWR